MGATNSSREASSSHLGSTTTRSQTSSPVNAITNKGAAFTNNTGTVLRDQLDEDRLRASRGARGGANRTVPRVVLCFLGLALPPGRDRHVLGTLTWVDVLE